MSEKYFEGKMNTKDVVKKLEELSEKTSHLKPLLRVCRRVLENYIDENFETEGKESGNKWQELTEEYAQKKQKEKAVDKILQFGGDLRTKIDDKVTDKSLIIGSALEYAAIHNFGMEGKMPQREFMRFSDYQLEDLIAELELYYMKNYEYIKKY